MDTQPTTTSTPAPKPIMFSSSSWATFKSCPHRLWLREQKWSMPNQRPDCRLASLAVPGLVIDKLFELWLYRREFENYEWLTNNFSLVWRMMLEQKRPKWVSDHEHQCVRRQTQSSVQILYRLLHQHDLLNDQMGVQTAFHESVGDGVSIAGAIDLWCIRKDNTFVIVDFKNFQSGTRRSVDQLHFYAMALKRIVGREPDEAGYVCFHPGYSGYRKTVLRQCDRNKLLARLARAVQARREDKHPMRWNPVSCGRYCEQRFACEEFRKRTGVRPT